MDISAIWRKHLLQSSNPYVTGTKASVRLDGGAKTYSRAIAEENGRRVKRAKTIQRKPHAFPSQPLVSCCKRRCTEYYEDDVRVDQLRSGVKLHWSKGEVADHAGRVHDLLVMPDGKRCCVKFKKWVFGVNNNNCYYKK